MTYDLLTHSAPRAMTAYAPTDELVQSWAKQPGEEPLPGYRLMAPLGRGGFGEVWKCEAPGGLHKAIKFVPSDEANHSLRQEYEAFQAIKAIRHPFLLQLERVELTARELIMVMELADTQLQERFMECRNAGYPGIPRQELLSYLADAAEALDVISVRHGLQHLDVKPANLFIVCGRVKVGDYGLVRAETTQSSLGQRGFTPRYVAPEVLKGRVDNRSDQYSLALVYQELLTGSFAYTARTAQQMMMAHSSAAPDLSSLPEEDVGPVALALSKQPEDRYPTCLAFVESLMLGGANAARHDTFKPHDTATVNAVQMRRVQNAAGYLSRSGMPTPGPVARTVTPAPQFDTSRSASRSGTVPLVTPPLTTPPKPPLTTPPLTTQKPSPPPARPSSNDSAPVPPAARQSFSGSAPMQAAARLSFSGPAPFNRPPSASRSVAPEEPVNLTLSTQPQVKINDGMLKSIIPTNVLTGQAVAPARVTADWFVNALMAAAIGETDALGRGPDGSWSLRFRSTHPVTVARRKLESLKSDDWFDDIIDAEPTRIQLRRFAATGFLGRFGGKKSGLELDITWPQGRAGEVELNARIFGEPDVKFTRGMAESMPLIFNEIRTLLKSGDERRKDPRFPADYDLKLYPLKDDGEILAPVSAKCRDLSSGGLSFKIPSPITTRYAFVEFPEITGVAGLAILSKMIRSQPNGHETLTAAKFRTHL